MIKLLYFISFKKMSKKLRISFFDNIKKSRRYFFETVNIFERTLDTLFKALSISLKYPTSLRIKIKKRKAF